MAMIAKATTPLVSAAELAPDAFGTDRRSQVEDVDSYVGLGMGVSQTAQHVPGLPERQVVSAYPAWRLSLQHLGQRGMLPDSAIFPKCRLAMIHVLRRSRMFW